jgi:hypothetical protein
MFWLNSTAKCNFRQNSGLTLKRRLNRPALFNQEQKQEGETACPQ